VANNFAELSTFLAEISEIQKMLLVKSTSAMRRHEHAETDDVGAIEYLFGSFLPKGSRWCTRSLIMAHQKYQWISGWWYTYPSEKYESQLG